MSVQLDVDQAATLAAFLYQIGENDEAHKLTKQILQGKPGNVPALLVDFCLAWKERNQPRARAILDALWKNPDALTTVPRLPAPETVPQLTASGLQIMFGDAGPPASDISDHLGDIYFETAAARPRLIVELGTRGGESTKALLAAAIESGARMLSVDIEPCSPDLPQQAQDIWNFVCCDDVTFGREHFAGWCAANGLPAEIDVLFIDTSHLYQHTCDELAVWMPLVASRGVVFFHDTHLSFYTVRNSGALAYSWDNQRGVIRAIEEYVGIQIDEQRVMAGATDKWAIRHNPKCNGFTVLRRLD